MKNLWLLALLCISGLGFSQNFIGGYPFVMPPYDSVASPFLPSFPAVMIGAGDTVSAQGGDFIVNGQPIVFWGVNLSAIACFPEKNKAAGVAARMRKMGINLVRFHHMDNPEWGGQTTSLFDQSVGTRTISPITLDRFEYFLFQLKRNNIYSNINLNVSRTFTTLDGVADADSLEDFGKAVTLFDPQLQTLQEEFAQQLLTHVNPYTGTTLANEPSVAMVETNNENTLYGFWKGDRLRSVPAGGSLIRRHVDMLDSLWMQYVRGQYASNTALASSWNQGSRPSGPNVARDGDFELNNIGQNYIMELHSTAAATISTSAVNPYAGTYCGQVDVTQVTGTGWHMQFKQSGGTVEEDSSYVVTFAARANAPRTLDLSVMRDNAPYTWYNGITVNLTTNWQVFTFTFVAPEDNTGNLRLSFGFNNQTGTYYFDDINVSTPPRKGLATNENLAFVPRINYSERLSYTDNRVADQAAFYVDVQQKHFDRMLNYVKDTLNVRAPITATNALVGPHDAVTHENLDYLDDHSYWDHPSFTSAAWDPSAWFISNTSSLLNDAGSIQQAFNGLNFTNKPYTVSEYMHASPNIYQTEMLPLLTAYASFHKTDGLMLFNYNGEPGWEKDHVDNYFTFYRNPALMAQMPACGAAYRRGLVAPANSSYRISYSRDTLMRMVKPDRGGRWDKFTPYDRSLNLTNHIEVDSYSASQPAGFASLPTPSSGTFVTDNNQTILNTTVGYLSTNTTGYQALTGPLNAMANVAIDDMRLMSGDGFGSLVWLPISGDSVFTADTSFVTLSSRFQNTGMIWNGTTTVNNNWGAGPTLMQPLNVQVLLDVQADTLLVYSLDSIGQPGAATTYLPFAPNSFLVRFNQNVDETPWFGLVAKGPGTITSLGLEEELLGEKDALAQPVGLTLSPNPVQDRVQLTWWQASDWIAQVRWLDVTGKVLAVERIPAQKGVNVQQIPVPAGLAEGMYMLRLEGPQGAVTKKVVVRY
ncbi:MAG: carbohydrate binding domain-containing protein [Bacteroidia bacterium]